MTEESKCQQFFNPNGFSPCDKLSELHRGGYKLDELLYPIGRPIVRLVKLKGFWGSKKIMFDYCPFCGFKFKGKATAYPIAAAEFDVELK